MLTGSLSGIFKVVPQHAIMILESNRSTRFVYCKGFTYNEYSKYPSTTENCVVVGQNAIMLQASS
jgi:hypothetical protein